MQDSVTCKCGECNEFRAALAKVIELSPTPLKPLGLFMLSCVADEVRILPDGADNHMIRSTNPTEEEERLMKGSVPIDDVCGWVARTTADRATISVSQIAERLTLLSKLMEDNTPDPELWVYTMLFSCLKICEDPRVSLALVGTMNAMKRPRDDSATPVEGSPTIH